jgi:hypothetical protein
MWSPQRYTSPETAGHGTRAHGTREHNRTHAGHAIGELVSSGTHNGTHAPKTRGMTCGPRNGRRASAVLGSAARLSVLVLPAAIVASAAQGVPFACASQNDTRIDTGGLARIPWLPSSPPSFPTRRPIAPPHRRTVASLCPDSALVLSLSAADTRNVSSWHYAGARRVSKSRTVPIKPWQQATASPPWCGTNFTAWLHRCKPAATVLHCCLGDCSGTQASLCTELSVLSVAAVDIRPLSLRKSLPHALAKPVSDHTLCDLYEVSGANTLANTITYKR